MNFMPILMDLIPVDPEPEVEIVEKGGPLSTVLIVAGIGCFAVALISYAIKRGKK